jgi:antitoxin component HigA of HigAB toxin-antitoxin module
MNKELLEPIMRAHGDKNKDLAAAIGMSVPNFSTIWNGRGEFALKYIRLIARRYSLTPEQVYKIFIFPQGNHCPCFFFGFQICPI